MLIRYKHSHGRSVGKYLMVNRVKMMGLGHFSSLQYTMRSRCLSVLIEVFFTVTSVILKLIALTGQMRTIATF